ncbi:unnamed protein product [Hyaloperonospora brassicae]|uniref:RxLR effector candidate protein n=1 Tax=Hyaloperonospora brassicae TaxID=162125 RepID=A0AAV0T942_HYABA|nr:unnamed protein product [Hyaloperonospora brassicae]
MRSVYLFAPLLSSALLATADLAPGLGASEVAAPGADAVEYEAAEDKLLRTPSTNDGKLHEDRAYPTEGVVGELVSRFRSTIEAIATYLYKASTADVRSTLYDYFTKDPNVRTWERVVEKMAKAYIDGTLYTPASGVRLGATQWLHESPGFRNVRPALKKMHKLHLLRLGQDRLEWKYDMEYAAESIYKMQHSHDPDEKKAGYWLKRVLFTSLILEKVNPEDVVAALLRTGKLRPDSEILKDMVVSYIEDIHRIRALLPK